MNALIAPLIVASLLSLHPATPIARNTVATSSGETAAAAEDARLEKVARELLANFVAGKFDDAAKDFDATMLAALPPSKLAQVSAHLKAQLGAFKSVQSVEHTTDEGYRVIHLISSYEKSLIKVRVVFDSDGKVAGLFFVPAMAGR